MGNNLAARVADANTTEPGTDIERPAPTLSGSIRDMQNEFALAMPKGMEAAQLVRDALTALRTTRNLAACDRASVLGGLMTCAQLGLRPGVLGHAWLLPFWDKNLPTVVDGKTRTGGYRAQLIIGYQGYRELGHRSGLIDTLIGRVIYDKDTFDVDYGLADNLVHKPRLDGDRGEAVGYYAIVKYTSGGHAFWHMSKTEVELHRDRFAMAKTREGKIVGPWRDNFDEMAVKTAFLRLAKWMPKSTEIAAAIEADETVRVDLSPDSDGMLHGEHPDLDGELVGDTDPAAEGSEPS